MGFGGANKEKTSVSCMETTSRDRIEELCSLIAPGETLSPFEVRYPEWYTKGGATIEGLCAHTSPFLHRSWEMALAKVSSHAPVVTTSFSLPPKQSNMPQSFAALTPFPHLNREQMPGVHAKFVPKLKLSLRGCVTKEELKSLLAAAQV